MEKKVPDLKRIIAGIDDLPTLPRTVLKITELVNDPKSSAKDLAKVITDDQILTARLLKLVNSSFYGLPQRISTVTGAIVLIGFDAIRNLLLTTSVFDLFAGRNKKKQQKQEQFWDHSLGCAVGAKVIGNYLRYDNIEELFVAGLLHDIGKIVEMMLISVGRLLRVSGRGRQRLHRRLCGRDCLPCRHPRPAHGADRVHRNLWHIFFTHRLEYLRRRPGDIAFLLLL